MTDKDEGKIIDGLHRYKACREQGLSGYRTKQKHRRDMCELIRLKQSWGLATPEERKAFVKWIETEE